MWVKSPGLNGLLFEFYSYIPGVFDDLSFTAIKNRMGKFSVLLVMER